MLKAEGLKGTPIIRGGLSASKTQIMTTLTSVKYITQQELLDVLPRTMYGEKGNAAPGPQLGHTMPVGLPFWLGLSKPFNLDYKAKRQGGVSIHIFLPYKACLTILVQHFPTMGKWTITMHVRGLMCIADFTVHGGKDWNKVWQCHREVTAGLRVSRGILEPVQTASLLEFRELEMRGVLPLSAGSKFESLL